MIEAKYVCWIYLLLFFGLSLVLFSFRHTLVCASGLLLLFYSFCVCEKYICWKANGMEPILWSSSIGDLFDFFCLDLVNARDTQYKYFSLFLFSVFFFILVSVYQPILFSCAYSVYSFFWVHLNSVVFLLDVVQYLAKEQPANNK